MNFRFLCNVFILHPLVFSFCDGRGGAGGVAAFQVSGFPNQSYNVAKCNIYTLCENTYRGRCLCLRLLSFVSFRVRACIVCVVRVACVVVRVARVAFVVVRELLT